MNNQKIYQILDANLNRAKEGLRVVEEYYRFVLENKKMTKKIKDLRHDVSKFFIKNKLIFPCVLSRGVGSDCLAKDYTKAEGSRKNLESVVLSNLQRAKEALRVLEEYGKLFNASLGKDMQTLRFSLYQLEEIIVKDLSLNAVKK
jgi:thiamine-phosphate pyrophosphorylase